MPSITAAEIIALLGWDADDTALADDVTATIDDAVDAVEGYCQTRFEALSATSLKFDSPNGKTLSLARQLRALSAVWLLDDTGARDSDITSDVVPRPNPQVMRDGSGNGYWTWVERRYEDFPEGALRIEVVGDWGMVTYPANIKRAIALTVKFIFDSRNVDANSATESGYGRLIQYNNPGAAIEVPPAAQKLLEKYKHHTGFLE